MFVSTIFGLVLMSACLLVELFNRIHLLSIQRKCLDYAAPADQIIFDSRRDSLPALQRSDPVYVQGVAALAGGSDSVGRVPIEWRKFESILLGGKWPSMGTAFLKRRQSPSGHVRLIAVDIAKASIGTWHTQVILPGTATSMPKTLRSTVEGMPINQSGLKPEFAVIAGQPDPIQLDHFTIEVIEDSHKAIFDGWLCDDDTVVLEMRRPSNLTPSAPPLPASSHSTDQSLHPAPLPAGR